MIFNLIRFNKTSNKFNGQSNNEINKEAPCSICVRRATIINKKNKVSQQLFKDIDILEHIDPLKHNKNSVQM